MRNKTAKRLKKEVMVVGYLGDGVTMEDLKKDRKMVLSSDEFKAMYRARKGHYNHDRNVQHPKHMTVDTAPDPSLKTMMLARKKKEDYIKRGRRYK